ncbi:MAG: porin family protein [Gemmatimonadota bacterium]|nr:porin family protein [Gemmatimonadota bacterium]
MLVRSIRGLVAATLLVAVAATASQAQMAKTSHFGLSGGISAPMGDFGDAADLGFIVGGQWSTGLGEKLNLRINVDLSRYGLPSGVDGNWMLIGGIANIVYPIATESGLKPYVLGGLGMINSKATITGFGDASSTDLAFNGGIGFDFTMGSRSWFTEVKYVSIQADGASVNYVPVVLGIKF